ncbi:MAG: alkaline phosphatase family protein [Lachnospiraceae bacterium]|nr:alkaline phosphatase family protein [Lachnospiraceae bacterium]
MNKIKKPEYENCIANLANSILAKWNLEQNGTSLQMLDTYMQNDYQNIVVILLDGMGKSIMEKNLETDGFLNTHLVGTYCSVFPPTTVAATTSVANGLVPNEHGWLGWDCYYPQIDKNVTVFFNVDQGTEKQAANYNVAWKYYGYENIITKIINAGGCAYNVSPFVEPYPNSFKKISDRIKKLCKLPERKYIYSYWNEPDSIMHKDGCYTNTSRKTLRDVERQIELLTNELDDTLLIITADHGHINSKGVSLTDYPRILECLIRMPSIEPRALNFFVKADRKDQFKNEFKKEFGNKFILWDKEKVIKEKIFGDGSPHSAFPDMIGDYLAIAVDDLSIYNTVAEAKYFKGAHAGLTEDEMIIPLIIVET